MSSRRIINSFVIAGAIALMVCFAQAALSWEGPYDVPAPVQTNTSGGLIQDPAIAVDGNGILHAVWIDGYTNINVYYAKSADNGTTWSTAKLLATPGWHPQIAVDGNNVIHVVWTRNTGDWTIQYCKSSDGGTTFTSPVNISGTLPSDQWPTIAADQTTSPAVHVVWRSYPGGIAYRRSTNSGVSWDTLTIIPGEVVNLCPSISCQGTSYVHILFMGMAGGGGLRYIRSSNRGTSWPTSSTQLYPSDIYSGTDYQCDVLATTTGKVYAVFASDGYLRSKVSTDNGATWSATINIASGIIFSPNIAVIGNGPVRVVYAIDGGAMVATSADGGTTWSVGTAASPSGFHADYAYTDIAARQIGSNYFFCIIWGNDNSASWDREVYVMRETWTPAPHLAIAPASLNFTAGQNGSLPASQTFTISNSGGGTMNWSISDNASWLDETPTSGNNNSQTITVSANTTNLAPACYNATITLSSSNADNSPQTVSVYYTVNGPHISLDKSSLNFLAYKSGSSPADQSFNISNTGSGTMNWSVSSNQTWLTVSPASGNDNSHSINVSVNPTSLAEGKQYTGTITVTASGADNTPQTIAVTLKYLRPTTNYHSNGSDFAMAPCDAWGFDNNDDFCKPNCSGFPSWDLFIATFSTQSQNSPFAVIAWRSLQSHFAFGYEGACYGMAYTAQLIKDQYLRLNSSGWTSESCPGNIHYNDIENSSTGRDYLNRYQLYQYGEKQLQHTTDAMDRAKSVGLKSVVDDLYDIYASGSSASLGLTWKGGLLGQQTFGHIVTPLSIKEDPEQLSKFKIAVYDNGGHNMTSLEIVIDTASNTWTYNWVTPWTTSELWVEAPTSMQTVPPTYPSLIPTRLNKRYNMATNRQSDSELVVLYAPQNADLLVRDGIDSLGCLNGSCISHFQGGSYVYPVSDSGFIAPPIYAFINRSINISFWPTTSDTTNIFLFRPGMGFNFGIDTVGLGTAFDLRVDSSDCVIAMSSSSLHPKKSHIDMVKVNQNNERSIEISNIYFGGADSLALKIGDFGGTPDDDYRIINYGSPQTIEVKLSSANTPSATFDAKALSLDSVSTYTIFANNDSLYSHPITIQIDHGNNGSIDSTIILQNSGYICGDANADTKVNVGDAVYLINYVFKSGPAPNPLATGDTNADGKVNVGDIVYLINYVFKAGPDPKCP